MNFINNFFVYRILVPKPLRTLIWKSFLKKKILSFYSNTNDIEKLWKKNSVSTPKIQKNEAKSNINKWKNIINTVNNFY